MQGEGVALLGGSLPIPTGELCGLQGLVPHIWPHPSGPGQQ
jgi:hypothetical protein